MTERRDLTVLTTGANSGIGLATAVHLARLGFRSVASVRSRAKAAPVRQAAAEAGVKVETVLLDVTDAQRCAALIDDIRPWGLVNNAGYSGLGAVEDVTDEQARLLLETMVVAPMRLARLSLRHMRAHGHGRIVNVSSIYGLTTTPFSGWYQASKHALEGVSDALRVEVARDGISVILIEPGGVKTGIWHELDDEVAHLAGSKYERNYGRTLGLVNLFMPLMGKPESVAKAIGKSLTVKWPRARYLIGGETQVVAKGQLLIPTELRDRVTRLVIGL